MIELADQLKACFALIADELFHIDSFIDRQNSVEKDHYKVNLLYKSIFDDSDCEKNADH